MRRLALALAVLGLLALAGCGGSTGAKKTAGAPGASRTAPGSGFVGVTSGALLSPGVPLAREMAAMRQSGVRSLRVPFYWRFFQPFAPGTKLPAGARRLLPTLHGVPTSFKTTDPVVEAAARAGLTLLPTVLGGPRWALRHPLKANSPPRGAVSYSTFIRTLVERYGPRGSFWAEHPTVPRVPIRDWQIWNEPNHVYYWSDQPFARDYVTLLRAARHAIHSADPGGRAVLAGFPERSWDLVAAVYRAGGRGAFDVAAVHPYTFKVPNVLKIARLVRAAMTKAGDARRPMMITEFGWSSGAGKVRRPFGFETTAADQATRLRAALGGFYAQRRALGIERVYWESWLTRDRDAGNPFDFAGLRELRPDGSVRDKPALGALRAEAQTINSGSR